MPPSQVTYDEESGPPAEESQPLLAGPAPASPSAAARSARPGLSAPRPSYRRRRISSAAMTAESYKNRWWTGVCAGVLAVAIMAAVAAVVVFTTTRGRRSPGGKETPDFTRLPPPQPGLRNPSYLVSGLHGAVASEVDICSQAGVDVLKEGGTATDAAIATTLCIGSTNMFSAGIGGGGFLVIRPSTTHAHLQNPLCTNALAIDFRETAPGLSNTTMFTPRAEDPSFDAARASKIGGLAIGVPGELRGLEAAYNACGGGVPWARLFEPAIALARELKVGKELGRRLNAIVFDGKPLSDWMLDENDWREMFAPEGKLLQVGETLRRENFARTLETIATEGADAFYQGPIAESLVSSAQAAGGILTLADLANYKAEVRPAATATYRNRTYYTGHYPSGGPTLTTLLNTLEGYDDFVSGGKTGDAVHKFVEALKFAFAARTEVGDPAFIDNDEKLAEILTKAYAAKIRENITEETHPLEYYHPRFDVQEDHGTTHLSVIDQWGSAVSVTSTVNLLFGSRVMDKATGVILNDEMDDFATPGIQDAFGLRPSPFNYPEPGKRPLSSTAPIVMDAPDGEVFLAVGGSGGSRIFGSVAQVILNLDWGYDLSNAVEQPRVHHQLSPPYVSIESGFRDDLIQTLTDRGHNTTLFDINLGIAECQAVLRAPAGRLFAASDSRKNGVPAAF